MSTVSGPSKWDPSSFFIVFETQKWVVLAFLPFVLLTNEKCNLRGRYIF